MSNPDKAQEIADNNRINMAPAEKVEESPELRYTDTVPLEKFRKQTIGIAGLGATGKAVATTLSVMGHKGMWGSDPMEWKSRIWAHRAGMRRILESPKPRF